MIPPPTELRQRGGDPDQPRLSAREPLADPAPHEERHEERVLAPVRRQNLLLEIGPVVHPLRLPLEGRAVGCAERDADAPCGLDPARLEARPERREVEDAVLHHEPRRDGARPTRRRVGRQVHPLRARAYQRVSFTPSQRPTWLTTMWPQKLSRRIVATSVHVSATRVWTRTSAPTTKSSWSNGIHGRPGSTPSRRLKRSEEHTSELQSPCNLVCRLLLEKKKKEKY